MFISGLASAQGSRGTYRCVADCATQSIPGEGINGGAESFIFNTVNLRLNVSQWLPGDTVTICNGSYCMTYRRTLTTWILQSVASDNNTSESGDTRRRVQGMGTTEEQVGAQCFAPTVFGHYEWWDYYSNDTYVGSSDRWFVVTNTIPGSMMNCT
jgi:hypothetical protein